VKLKIDPNQLFFYGGLVALFVGLALQYSIGIALIVVGTLVAGGAYFMAWKMANAAPIEGAEKNNAA